MEAHEAVANVGRSEPSSLPLKGAYPLVLLSRHWQSRNDLHDANLLDPWALHGLAIRQAPDACCPASGGGVLTYFTGHSQML